MVVAESHTIPDVAGLSERQATILLERLGFRVTARSDDGAVMAVEHGEEPMLAVQFHPESIMSLGGNVGIAIVENALAALLARRGAAAGEKAA